MIGDTLRREREKQKLSIQDVEQATSIRSVYINALEKGEYDKLPGEVYAKGFIKNYGNFLNLNGEELVRQFIMEISTVVNDSAENPSAQNKNSDKKIAATNVGEKYRSQQTTTTENFSNKSDTNSYMIAAVVALAILIGGIFYSFQDSDSEIAENDTVKTQTVNNETPKTEEIQQVQVAEVQTQPTETVNVVPPPTIQDVTLHATFSDDCWTRVIIDGAMFYEGMIGAGETFDWKGTQSVSVLLGNAGAVQFMMNGQSIGTLGGYGDVVERTFTL